VAQGSETEGDYTLNAIIGLTPTPLAGEGWGGGGGISKTEAFANLTTLSPTLPRQGGERSEGAEKSRVLRKS